jgi:hypothetical protein
MSKLNSYAAFAGVLALATLAGCGGGDSPGTGMTPAPGPAPAAPNPDFTSYVKALVAAPSEIGSPAVVEGVTFDFKDDDNAGAYTSILPP